MDVNAFQLLTDSNFQVSSKLGTATLNVNATVFDPASAKRSMCRCPRLDRDGGSFERPQHLAFAFRRNHCPFEFQRRNARRSGNGTIRDCLEPNFADAPAVFAFISKYSNGSVSITH